MDSSAAYEMGHDAAACGFFFDGMELVAAVSPRVPGGLDGLRGAIELLFAQRDAVNARTARMAQKVGAAFDRPTAPPTTVDAYRTMLESGVFEIVNRWSYIADIKQVNRLQAWFYAGFGLGRAETVTRAIQLTARIREIVEGSSEADQSPEKLQRLAAEAVKQIEVAAEEDDLRSVRPLFDDAARRLKRTSVALLGDFEALAADPTLADDLVAYEDLARRIALDLARR
jgi:hypothetical protein